jgi:fatty acid synthase
MWLSAAAQHVATATDGKPAAPAKLVGWTARFLGMVLPGDEVEFRVDRVGIDRGAEVLEISARVGSDLKMSATARLAAPKTVYAFPGQGIQSKGMGMEVRARSKAARKIWDRADKFTREALGFSVLHVVKDNPTSLIANGVHYQHPEGVLYLTQFTQVAMATTAAARLPRCASRAPSSKGPSPAATRWASTPRWRVSAGHRTGGPAGGRVPSRLQHARHRSARRAGPLQLPDGGHPAVADRPGRRRRPGLRRRGRRAHR